MGNKTSWTRGDHETVRVKTLSSSHSHLQVVSKSQQFKYRTQSEQTEQRGGKNQNKLGRVRDK